MGPRRAVIVALGLVVAMIAVGGCTQREGPADETLPTTTTLARTTTSGSATASTLAGRTPDQIRDSLTSAVSARNFCALTAALDDAVPDVTDGQAVISTYQALDSAVHAATAFRPAALADSWTVVTAGVDEGVAAAKRVGGDLNDPALQAPFTAGDFEAAMTLVESWSDANCSPG
jgi:hypothetical protein